MESEEKENATESRTFRLTGLGNFVTRVQRRLAALPVEKELAELQHSLSVTARRIELSMGRSNLQSANLTATSRQHRGWITLLNDPEMLKAYCHAASVGSAIVSQALQQIPRWKTPVRVYFRPMRGLYQLKPDHGGTMLSIPTPGIIYRAADFQLIAQHILHRAAHCKQQLVQRMACEDFQVIAEQIEVLGGVVDLASGKHFDLNQIFDRVNDRYFQGQVKRPKLYWSKTLTHRKFGHYDWVHDAIMLSRTMDSLDVPVYVVDFVMYHEMLHKVLGLIWTGSRNYAHTAEFYAREKQFAEFDQAEKMLQQLALKHRG